MGYTHYYYVSSEFDKKEFANVAKDFKKMVTPLKHLGVVLADGWGDNHPRIAPTKIIFNGLEKCGHEERDLGITWPSDKAIGIIKNGVGTKLREITNSQWFAGAQLETRACGGDCSHETFSLFKTFNPINKRYDGSEYVTEPQGVYGSWTDSKGKKTKNKANIIGKFFDCCKTAYKPYDLAVTICLVIAKHYLKNDITISSDGNITHWQEAMQLCQHFLGYGEDFTLDK